MFLVARALLTRPAAHCHSLAMVNNRTVALHLGGLLLTAIFMPDKGQLMELWVPSSTTDVVFYGRSPYIITIASGLCSSHALLFQAGSELGSINLIFFSTFNGDLYICRLPTVIPSTIVYGFKETADVSKPKCWPV